jgi:hypothetical protein
MSGAVSTVVPPAANALGAITNKVLAEIARTATRLAPSRERDEVPVRVIADVGSAAEQPRLALNIKHPSLRAFTEA